MIEGIDAAVAAGLPVKVNAVIKRGVNDDQIVPMAAFFRERGQTLRFIEYMDVGHTNGWRLDDVVPAAEIVAALDAEFGVEPAEANYRGEVAQALPLPRRLRRDRRDRVGHTAVLRRLHPRAPLGRGKPLHVPLRRFAATTCGPCSAAAAPDEEIEAELGRVWAGRADRYSDLRSAATDGLPKVEMSYIGG